MRHSILHICLAMLIVGSFTLSAASRPHLHDVRFAQAEKENMGPMQLANAWIDGQRQAREDPSLLADDAVLEIAGMAPIEGRQPVVEFTDGFYGAIGDRTITVETAIADGNEVSALLEVEGRHTGTLFGVPATGRRVDFTVMGFIDAKNGQITRIRVVLDRYGLLQQIGAVPAPSAVSTA